jgi:hypothetical protein
MKPVVPPVDRCDGGREAEVGDRGRGALARAGDETQRVEVWERPRAARERAQLVPVEAQGEPDDASLVVDAETMRVALDDGDAR